MTSDRKIARDVDRRVWLLRACGLGNLAKQTIIGYRLQDCWLVEDWRLVFWIVACLQMFHPAAAEELPPGFTKIEGGKHLTVITDYPISDTLRQLPQIFDQAMPKWCQVFEVKPATIGDWRATLHLMLDRDRFQKAGLIPAEVPNFRYGWQYGDKLWVDQQPSDYYVRHLMLHEGTHWFMYRKYGFYDAPWFAEGMAEWLGTHRWNDQKLELGVIPRTKEEVPFWGRIKLVRDQCIDGLAPSLEQILRYDKTAHQNVDAYAWSWAMVLFLKHHPDSQKVFAALLKQPAMETKQLERWLRIRLSSKLPELRAAWQAFITDLDYGFSPVPGLLNPNPDAAPLEGSRSVEIRADQNWQSAGVTVSSGQKVDLAANGQYQLGQSPRPWNCQPDGVTLEYYRGQPLGKLMLAIVAPVKSESSNTEMIHTVPVGSQLTLTCPHAGELFFRVNEPTGQLIDNSGSLTVQLQLATP